MVIEDLDFEKFDHVYKSLSLDNLTLVRAILKYFDLDYHCVIDRDFDTIHYIIYCKKPLLVMSTLVEILNADLYETCTLKINITNCRERYRLDFLNSRYIII
jgi:hypothetical protein